MIGTGETSMGPPVSLKKCSVRFSDFSEHISIKYNVVSIFYKPRLIFYEKGVKLIFKLLNLGQIKRNRRKGR